MNRLEKWFPNMFKRSTNQQDETPSRMSSEQANPLMPASMNRLFDQMLSERLWRDPFALMSDTGRFFGDFAPRSFQPSVDVIDEGSHIRVSAELPGLDRDDVELTINEGALTIRGEKKMEQESNEEGCYRVERYFGRFQRLVPLPAEIDVEHAEASFEKGVLDIRLPKTETQKTSRKIPLH